MLPFESNPPNGSFQPEADLLSDEVAAGETMQEGRKPAIRCDRHRSLLSGAEFIAVIELIRDEGNRSRVKSQTRERPQGGTRPK